MQEDEAIDAEFEVVTPARRALHPFSELVGTLFGLMLAFAFALFAGPPVHRFFQRLLEP